MPEKIEPELLYFLQPSALPVTILVVESVGYLPKLREMFPAARLLAVADEEDALDLLPQDLEVEFHCLDYLAERLPFEPKSLDYIISDLTLERAGNPQDIAAGFSTYLKETGAFLTSFRNIRHWSVLEELRDGHYYQVVSRLFARPEFERLLYASFYKDIFFAPVRGSGTEKEVETFVAAGFENRLNDLDTETWLVKAMRSSSDVALLKAAYTPEVRKKLATLLRRVEYGIDLRENVGALWALIDQEGITAEYMACFSSSIVVHGDAFCKSLAEHSSMDRASFLDEMWTSLYQEKGR